jgi:anti-sigma factor RsiW
MLSCDECRELIAAYVDNNLTDTRRHALQQHLTSCENCHKLTEQEVETHELLRAESPLFEAPEALIHRVRRNLQTANPARLVRYSSTFILLVSVIALFSAILIFMWQKQQHEDSMSEVSQFAKLSVDTHMRRLNNQLPLEIVSESPEVISEWFSNKVNFHFELPNYPVSGGYNKKYVLEGARLISFNNDYAANVSYRMNNNLISLVVIPETLVTPSGGEEVMLGNIRFHVQDHLGFHVITWSHRSLTYALVSKIEQSAEAHNSCMVCHQETEKERITLRP